MMHPDSRIRSVLQNWAIERGSSTHVWVNDAFDDWEQFYGYFETMFEGCDESEALECLRTASGEREVVSSLATHDHSTARGVIRGTRIHLSILAGSPGAVRELLTKEQPLASKAGKRELNRAIAEMYRAVGYVGRPAEERHLIAGVEFILGHGLKAMAAALVHSSLFRLDHVVHTSEALRLGVPVEYVAHSKKEYTGEDIAYFYHNNVPTEWTNVFGVFITYKFAATASEITQMYKNGVDADYLTAYVKSAKYHPKEGQLPLIRVAQAWADGIPLEYLLAGTA